MRGVNSASFHNLFNNLDVLSNGGKRSISLSNNLKEKLARYISLFDNKNSLSITNRTFSHLPSPNNKSDDQYFNREKKINIDLKETIILEKKNNLDLESLANQISNMMPTDEDIHKYNNYYQDLPPLRKDYMGAVDQLNLKFLHADLDSIEDLEHAARSAHAARRAVGGEYKDLTPPDKLKEIHQRNEKRYGDKLGPTFEYLRDKDKTLAEILLSAGRYGGKDLKF